MEDKEGYHFAPRTGNPTTYVGATMQSSAALSAPVAAPPGPGTGSEIKKKRGRPRKYAPDGSLATLSPTPISSSIPLTEEFSFTQRGRGPSVDTVKESHKYEPESSPGEGIAYFVGANFTPHVITVNAGEDVTTKVMSFSQQGSRAICILSANGTISNATLRQPASSSGTLTYEGRFEILSLTGSLIPTENGGTKSRSGGMSVSLAGVNGHVLGGELAGLLVAAGPVQIVVGSFLPGQEQEQKHKKQRTEPAAAVVSPTAVHTTSTEEIKVSYGGVNPILTSPSFRGNSSGTWNPWGYRNSATDNKSSSSGEEQEGHSQSQ